MAMWCERLVLLVVSLLLAGSCAGQWAVVKGYRVVMKADIVRDFPGMCYDVSSCSARAVNESWAIGICSRAACEMDESGILLEVHYACPRLQNRPTLLCDIIEDKRLPFPACCPRMICQRHKKQPPPTQTQLKPFTPHVSVDKELRKIPFVLKRPVHMFLEVQNTTLLDAIILNRIKALEAAAVNASAAANGTLGDAAFRGPTNVDDMVEAVLLTTQGPGVTTQDTTPFGTTDGAVTTTSPVQTTPTVSPVEIIRGTGFQSDSLQQEPRKSVTVPSIGVEDDDELFLNDAPVVPSSEAESTTRVPETPKATTTAKQQLPEEVTELTRTAVFASDHTNKPATAITTEPPRSEPSTEIYDETTTRSLGLTVPESIFATTSSPSTELLLETTPTPPTTTETIEQTTTKQAQGDAGKKSGNLPTILRSLVDNVFDYYDYIDYYVPGQKRNLTPPAQERPGDRRRIPESMMALVKEQLSKQKDTNESSLFVEDLQGDQPAPKDDPESTTPDPDNQEFQKELVTKMAVDIARVTKQNIQDTTTAFARTETATQEATRADVASTTAATPTEATSTATTSKQVVDSTIEGSTGTTTLSTGRDTTLTLVKSVGTQSRAKVNLAIENLSSDKPEDRTATDIFTSTVTTSAVPQSTLTPTTLSRTTPVPTTLSTPASTQEVTTAAVTTTRTTAPPETSRQPETTQSATRSYQTAGETETAFVGTTNANAPGTTSAVTTTATPSGAETSTTPSTTIVQQSTTTTRNVETTRPATSTKTAGTTTSGTRQPQTVTITTGSRASSEATETTPQLQTTIQTQPLLSGRNDTIPLLTSPEPATASVTAPATPTTPPSTSTRTSERPLGDAPSTVRVNVLQKDGAQQQRSGNATTKGQPTPPTNNNDVEYIDYVYYYDYIDTSDNSTANGTTSSPTNSTGTRLTKLSKSAK
ncbi:uncharacterized protein LOC142578280 [Dermacentor variabilis]|uniref:uncharacterized protein LOC142578280 n=1 Tax=Dermacentor variabilis TaxID=34621 RepID=UPI003F5BCED7